jgi:shikimate kinase
MNKKKIYLLIGPKGSGKSFIGALMEKEFGIKFIRVEDWVKEVKNNRQIDNQSYINESFQAIEKGVRKVLNQYDKVLFESTGLSDYFDQMLKKLNQDFSVISIRIQANDELCLNRVKTRDQSIHINVSDDQVNKINRLVREKEMKTDFTLINENKSADEIVIEITELIKKYSH